MTKRVSIITHVPVLITADSPKSLREAVKELRSSGVSHQGQGEDDFSSFKIITKGVKLKDVRQQWEKVVMEYKGHPDDADIFRSSRRSARVTRKKKK